MGELCRELAPLFVGATVESAIALPPRDLVLIAAAPGGPHLRLHLSADPDLPRLFLQAARQKRPRGPVGPFFRSIEERVVGARITAVEQLGGDRIARVALADPAGSPLAIVLELTGRHANLILVEAADRVVEVLVPPRGGPKATAAPRLVPGAPWVPPPGRPPADGTAGDPPLEQALPPAPPDGSGAAHSMDAHPGAPLSFLVERALGAELEAGEVEHARRELVRRVERKLARSRRNLAGLEERAAAADGADRVREEGELLKAHLGRWKRGAREVEVEDFFADEAGVRRRIELDPKLAPAENVERVFARYRKLLRVQASAHQDLAYAGERVAELEALLARAEESDDPAALDEQAVARGLLPKVQEAPPPGRRPELKQRLPYRSFRGAAGGEIRVGRSARDNDELTMRQSKGSDLWLHTADVPGSHVVLCLDKGAEADPEEVLDAAHLAVHFSPLKGARRADVHVAARKLVHKPKGAKAGLVTLSGGKVLSVRMQPERLERLLGSGRPPAGGQA